jgi:pimeloyl-ACP methyl ester carboxylesterase
MYLELNDAKTYVATGGKPFDNSLPTVVFIHGSGLDHRCWALQTRWFAFHGYSVVAPDFPAHSLSEGEALNDISAMATWLWQLLDQLGAKNVTLVGHSQGGLVALEAAAQRPAQTNAISIWASGSTIPVNPQLLDLAENHPEKAAAAMLTWGFGERYQFGGSAVPGQAPIGIGSRIMSQNPLHQDLLACNSYSEGANTATKLTMPSQLILAKLDKMTPLKAGRALAQLLPNLQSQVELEQVGHMLPMEAPKACLDALKTFIQSQN